MMLSSGDVSRTFTDVRRCSAVRSFCRVAMTFNDGYLLRFLPENTFDYMERPLDSHGWKKSRFSDLKTTDILFFVAGYST